jgi:hypothetical protein
MEDVKKERQIAATVQQMTQGFQADAQNARQEFTRPLKNSNTARNVLSILLSDMLEATEHLKDDETLTSMALDDKEGLESGRERQSIAG